MSAASDLRTLLAKPRPPFPDTRDDKWIREHGDAVLALLDAALDALVAAVEAAENRVTIERHRAIKAETALIRARKHGVTW